jgi:hypothetical protein
MTATQSTRRHGASLWRAACRAAAALRAIHHEQVLMWELVCPSNRGARGPCRAAGLDPEPGRAPADRPPPAQPRRTPGRAQAMTGTPRPRPAAAAAAAGQPGQRLERK